MSCYTIQNTGGHKHMLPVTCRSQYLALRGSSQQQANLRLARSGNSEAKRRLVQMNYSCLPGDDGALRGSTRPSDTVGMDVDFDPASPDYAERMATAPQAILARKDELGLMMLERSATKGFHIVFRRRQELSQEDNLRWASSMLGIEYDRGAKDITRVFFTTGADEKDLLFLDDALFGTGSTASEPCHPANNVAEVSGLRSTPPAANGAPHKETPETAPSTNTTPLQRRPETTATESPCPDKTFRHIPYSAIISAWLSRTGGTPSRGERNVRLYQLASALRAVADNDQQLLLQIMPSFGLADSEMRAIIASACKEPPKGLTRAMREVVDTLEQEYTDADCTSPDEPDAANTDAAPRGGGLRPPQQAGTEAAEGGRTPPLRTEPASPLASALDRLAPRLPPALKASLSGVPQNMRWPVIAAVLPIAAAYADQVEAEYCDGARQHLGLMSIILGDQASGKSVCKQAVDLWKRQLDREDALARQHEDEWKAQRKARKANEKAPDDPQVLIRVLPVTVSCSTLLRRLKNSRGHTVYSFGEELDTLRKTNGAGSWSSKYDIYRLAFDRGEWGQDYNSDQAESGVVSVAYNWTMLGTYGAMRKCFKADNIENGLSSRVIVADMPDNSFAPMPHYRRRSPQDEQLIDEGTTRLRQACGFVDTPRLRRAIGAWVEEKRVEAAKDIDRVKDTYRKRAAVIGFRAGVVAHLLAGDGRESKTTVDFAIAIAELTLTGQMRTFGETLLHQYVEATDTCRRQGCNMSVFDQLPPTFTLDELRQLKRGFCSEASLRSILSRWVVSGWTEKIDKMHWRKKELTA